MFFQFLESIQNPEMMILLEIVSRGQLFEDQFWILYKYWFVVNVDLRISPWILIKNGPKFSSIYGIFQNKNYSFLAHRCTSTNFSFALALANSQIFAQTNVTINGSMFSPIVVQFSVIFVISFTVLCLFF